MRKGDLMELKWPKYWKNGSHRIRTLGLSFRSLILYDIFKLGYFCHELNMFPLQ